VAIAYSNNTCFVAHVLPLQQLNVAIDLNPMATTIFPWVNLFRHESFVRGVNLWQQLSNCGEKLLQHTHFGGDI
jgi:hypothetical protein